MVLWTTHTRSFDIIYCLGLVGLETFPEFGYTLNGSHSLLTSVHCLNNNRECRHFHRRLHIWPTFGIAFGFTFECWSLPRRNKYSKRPIMISLWFPQLNLHRNECKTRSNYPTHECWIKHFENLHEMHNAKQEKRNEEAFASPKNEQILW